MPKRPIIQVPRGAVARIMRDQNAKKSTVYSALNYTSYSESAESIRRVALDVYGGIKTFKAV